MNPRFGCGWLPVRTQWLCGLFVAWLMACASVPQALSELAWSDQQGDRGAGVAQRDLGDCLAVVETRRSLVGACMQARGWVPLAP